MPLSEYENWHELIVWAALFGKERYCESRGIPPQTSRILLAAYPGVYGHYYGYHYFYVSNTKGLATGGYSGSGAGGGFLDPAGGGAGAWWWRRRRQLIQMKTLLNLFSKDFYVYIH